MAALTQKFHYAIAIVLLGFLAACGRDKPNETSMTSMPPLPVSVIDMQSTSVPISAEAVAQTEGAKEVEIRPRVGGILLKKLFEEGAPIKVGQPMFLIDPAPYQIAVQQARAQLAQQRARIEQTQRESIRLKGLLDTQSISQREYDNAVSENAVASASILQYEALLHEAELNLSYTTVTSPASGIAGRFLLSEGALVAPNTSLLTSVVQISPIWVRFSFSDADLATFGGHLKAQRIQKINLTLPDGTLYPESGKLNFSASQIDPSLGTQQLRAVFQNADQTLLPGQFVRIKVTAGTKEGVFLVPQTAVLTGDQGKFVFVAEKDVAGKFVAGIRPIQEGGWQGAKWVVLAGLKEGDQVLIDNLIKVRPGAPISPHVSSNVPITPSNKSI